jgi:predicted nuclease of predicted toxin-antitoxin system
MGAKRRKSRKQLTTNTRYQKQLERITFFLERSLGGNFILTEFRKAKLKVEPHSAWFRHDTPDTEWLPVAGKNKWVVLMRDQKIGTRRLELEALLNSRVKAFVLTTGELRNKENARIFINAMPAICNMVERLDFPFIARVSVNGAVKIWKSARRKR